MRVPGHNARTRRGNSQRSHPSQARWLNALTATLLLAGLLANFVTFAPVPVAAQQKDNTPPPYPTPQSVVAVGSFQSAVGCGQDFDKECDLTQLQSNSDGAWTGTFQIPAGSYTYRIVTRSDIDRSFGKDGDPNGDDISLDVPDGALGVFFSFNEWTGEIYAVPVTNQIELSTDLGQFPMQPNKDGGAFAVIDAQPNSSFGAQVILDGNPVGDVVTVDTGDSGRVVVTMDQNGNLKSDSVEPSTLTVTKTDADGNPLPGACFSVYDGKDVAGQGCDSSDGEDGSTRIEFPVGAGNGLELRETRTPDGQERADSQDIDLNPGDNQVTVTAGGGGGEVTPPEEETATTVEEETPTEQVTPELGTITLYTVDENGDPVPGVCYTVSGYGDVQCDEDGDGDMGLTDVPAGDYTAQQASVPDGYQLDNQQQTITVSGGEEATATFTSPTTQAQTFTVTVAVSDQDGNPVPGACFTVTDANGNQGSEQCDDDQNGDVQFDLANGDYTLSMTTTPDGFETPQDQSFTVSDQNVDLQVSVNAIAPSETATTGGEGNGAINVSVTDQDGFAIIGACVTIQGPTSGEVCDNGDGDANGEDGLIRIENLPDGEYSVSVSQLPEGFEPAAPVTVTISGGQEVEASLVSGGAVEPTATEAPNTGSLLIRKYDPNRESLAGACFSLTDANGTETSLCDNQDGDTDNRDGRIRIDELAPGDYTVTETQAPDGYTAGEPKTITIVAGETARLNFTNSQAEGTVNVTTTDGTNAIGGACYDLSGIGQQCDDDGDGTVTFGAVPPGDYTVTQSSVPAGYSPSDPVDQPVTVAAGETAQAQFTVSVAQASLLVSVVDENGNAVAGACVTVNDGTPVCDNDGTDGNGDSGQILISGLTPGDATVTMSTTPDGYTDGGSTTVTLQAGQQSTVTFTLSVALGRLGIYTTSAAGDPLGGACYTITDANGNAREICDNGDGDENSDPGVMRVTGITPGDYTISQTTVPDGFQQAADQTFTVDPGARTRIDFVNEPSAGSLTVTVTDDNGNAVPGACVTATDASGNATQVCDNQDPDQNPADGVIAIPNLAPGDYTVIVTSAPEGYQIPDVGQSAAVPAGGEGSAALPIAIIPPTETPTEIPTETPTEVPTETPSEVPTETPTEVPTETATLEPTVTETATEEPTATETATEVPAETETATAEATASETATEAPTEEATATETAPAAVGSIRINVTDPDGNALVGACFSVTSDTTSGEVCDNQAGDEEPGEGIVQLGSLPAGEYTVTESQAPDGYTAPAPQTATIANDGDVVELTFVNEETPVATGNLRITSTGPDGNPVGGACYQIGSTEACDNQNNDAENAPGVVVIEGIPVGDYTVTETDAPEGFQPAAAQTVTIESNATAELTFAHEAAPPETGTVAMQLKDQDGNPADGACVLLSSEQNDIADQQYCDNGEGDQNSDPAMLEVTDLPVGSYSAKPVPEGETANSAFASATFDQSTFTVKANVTIQVVVIIIIQLPEVGDLQITKRAADTGALQTGACFRVTGEGNEIEVCDNDDVDLNGSNGIIRLSDLSSGNYTIKEITAPPGYQLAPDKTTTVPNGGTRSVLIKDQPVADTTGGLIVQKVDDNGTLLPGACFQLRDQGTPVATVCDTDDGTNDGKTTFADINVGDYRLRETQAPSADYLAGADVTVNIYGGVDDQTIDVVNTLKPGQIRITKVAEDGTTKLDGACFGLDRGSGIEYEACDNGAGDTNATVGIILMANIPPDNWTLIETVPPSGYDPAADQAITVNPGQTLNVTIQNTPTPPSTDKGTVVINKLVGSDLAPGACFALRQGAVTRYSACDGTNNDGKIEFPSVTVGNYTVHETKAPNPTSWYVIGADKNISVTKNQTTTVDITNTLKPGRILVIKKNTSGTVLQNACFKITPDPNGAGQRCTNATGQVSFDNLPTTQTYKLTESKAPTGYEKAKDVTNISLTPGLTTTVNVIDKKAPPPPDQGSIFVIKFFCPAGKGGELTTYLDSSNPGGAKLAQTSGCTKGDAKFSLVPKAGGTGFEFNTGPDGQYFTPIAKGTWELRELAPQKSDAEDVLIYAGQQTTVVVIDYVKPPEPKPATINILKYTCAPGFGGVYYADFLNNCTADSQLTNNVSFRTSGPTVAKRITGATGQPGKTTFTQLKAGDYTLFEDKPSTAVSVYAFCGYDVYNWADWFSATGSINLPLKEGANVTCIWFNVPDDLSDSTGAIVVHKYVCNGTTFPSGYDYFANCPVETDNVKFAISVKQGNSFVPKTTGITNQNGILSFGRLKPGTYSLKEIGGDWCNAKSDDVDAQGNLIVRAGQRTNVWIFNCVPTKQPPNTGSGAMAGVIGGGAVSTAGSTLVGFAWPIFGLIGFRARKKLRRAA